MYYMGNHNDIITSGGVIRVRTVNYIVELWQT